MRWMVLAVVVVLSVSLAACADDAPGEEERVLSASSSVHDDQAEVPAPHDCQGERGGATDVAGEPPWRQHAPYRVWTDEDGCRIRIDVLAERPGPEHCDWQSASVLITGRPVGARYSSVEDNVEYVRDPEGTFGRPELTNGLDLDADLPDNATDTGFRRGAAELWTVNGDDSAVWIVERGRAERWPAGTTPGCA